MARGRKAQSSWIACLQALTSILRQAFDLFDTDKGGTIDAKELGAALRSMGQQVTDAEVKEMLKEVRIFNRV